MDKKDIINMIKSRRERLRSRGVKKIGLFGSYLKGAQKRGSDIDLLVEFNEITARGYFNLLRYFENMFGKKVDLVISEDLRPELNHIKKDAIYVEI